MDGDRRKADPSAGPFGLDQAAPGAAARFVSLFDLATRFFVPTRGLGSASCRAAVKAGRRDGGAARGVVSRPRLDGGEHGARLGGPRGAVWWPSAAKRAGQSGPRQRARRPRREWRAV